MWQCRRKLLLQCECQCEGLCVWVKNGDQCRSSSERRYPVADISCRNADHSVQRWDQGECPNRLPSAPQTDENSIFPYDVVDRSAHCVTASSYSNPFLPPLIVLVKYSFHFPPNSPNPSKFYHLPAHQRQFTVAHYPANPYTFQIGSKFGNLSHQLAINERLTIYCPAGQTGIAQRS